MSSTAGTIKTCVTMVLMLTIGLIYDVFGRKTPLLIFVSILVLVELIYPFIENEMEYYTISAISSFFPVVITNPFIPDLI